ncbi:MAG: SIS domain-containing protein [Pseudomonadota bacterium]
MSDATLQALYPFLHGERQDEARQEEAALRSIAAKCQDSLSVKERFFTENARALLDAARAIARVYANGGRMFAMGNGGSSCDAAHFAVEFQHPVTTGRPALPAMNLVMDAAMMTAVSNDVGVEQLFARQLEAHAKPGDGLIGFSTSGNSTNLTAAFRRARQLNLVSLGLCGGDGGDMASSGLVEHCLVVPSSSIHRVQESHVAAYHILWDVVHTLLADDRGCLASPEHNA